MFDILKAEINESIKEIYGGDKQWNGTKKAVLVL